MIASPAAESRLFTFESRLDRFVEQRLDAIRAFLEASPGGTLELADPAGFGHAIIALDETNQIRDGFRWDDVRQRVGIETAQQFWTLCGKDVTL